MSAVKKKPKKIRISQKKLDKLAGEALDNFTKESEKRYERAMKVYNTQKIEAQDALDRMIDILCVIARRKLAVRVRGSWDDAVVFTIPDEVIKKNMTYMAVEILKDLVYMDVQVDDFHWPTDICAECGAPVTPKKKEKK